MATFLANEINSPGIDITGQTAHFPIVFPLKVEKHTGYLETSFRDVDE